MLASKVIKRIFSRLNEAFRNIEGIKIGVTTQVDANGENHKEQSGKDIQGTNQVVSNHR
jgi:hypothetical protein